MKILVLLSGLCLAGFAASAQMRDSRLERPANVHAPNPADDLTRKQANELRLNEAQYIRLRIVNAVKLNRIDEIEWQFPDNPAARREKLVELEVQYEQECRRILTPSQLSQLHNDRPLNETPPADPNDNALG